MSATKQKFNEKKVPKIKTKTLDAEAQEAIKEINNKKKNTPAKKTPEPNTNIETKQHFYIGCVIGVRYVIDTKNDKPSPERQTKLTFVWSEKDLANEPAAADDLIVEAENHVLDEGYFLTEEDAFINATVVAGRTLSNLAHDLEYTDGPCRNCTRYIVKDVEELLKIARDFSYRHHELCLSSEGMAGVRVFPDPEDMDYFKFVGGKAYLKNPPKNYTEHCLKVSGTGDLSKVIGESIDKWLKERNKK